MRASEINIEDFRRAKPASVVRTGYAVTGEEIDPDDQYCVAVKANNHDEQVTHFFVKSRSGGTTAGDFFNPLAENESAMSKNDHEAGRPRYEFRRVTRTAFERYVQFLQTKNEAYLSIAQRENV